METGKNNAIDKKTYEIGYAVWRIAEGSSEKAFADIFRRKAIELIGLAADNNYLKLDAALDALHAVTKFGVDVNCISIGNAAILAREIGNVKIMIQDFEVVENMTSVFSNVDISNIFSNSEPDRDAQEVDIADIDFAEMPEIDNRNNGNDSGGESGKKAEMRQSAILEKIRQSGNCRLSDIQAILPETSERTIRYDLESLVQRNLIERLGIGGRSTYYRAR